MRGSGRAAALERSSALTKGAGATARETGAAEPERGERRTAGPAGENRREDHGCRYCQSRPPRIALPRVHPLGRRCAIDRSPGLERAQTDYRTEPSRREQSQPYPVRNGTGGPQVFAVLNAPPTRLGVGVNGRPSGKRGTQVNDCSRNSQLTARSLCHHPLPYEVSEPRFGSCAAHMAGQPRARRSSSVGHEFGAAGQFLQEKSALRQKSAHG